MAICKHCGGPAEEMLSVEEFDKMCARAVEAGKAERCVIVDAETSVCRGVDVWPFYHLKTRKMICYLIMKRQTEQPS